MSNFRVGILGFGYIAKIHIENILKIKDVKISSIFSATDKREKIPKKISFYMNYKKMLSEQDLDAILICTPTCTHQEIVCYCAQQGIRHIFLEKPMALNAEECNIILDTIKEYKSHLLIGHVLRFWPTYGSVQEEITQKNSKIGEIQALTSKRLGTFPPWSKWFADQNKSGGVILDLSIHDIDYALWLLGEPISISCQAKTINRYGYDVVGESLTKIMFKENKTAECEASWAKPADFNFYTYTKIEGTSKVIEFDGTKIFNNNLHQIQNKFPSEDGYFNQMSHFFDAALNQKDFTISGEDGLKAVQVCIAANQSAFNKGKEIFFDEME